MGSDWVQRLHTSSSRSTASGSALCCKQAQQTATRCQVRTEQRHSPRDPEGCPPFSWGPKACLTGWLPTDPSGTAGPLVELQLRKPPWQLLLLPSGRGQNSAQTCTWKGTICRTSPMRSSTGCSSACTASGTNAPNPEARFENARVASKDLLSENQACSRLRPRNRWDPGNHAVATPRSQANGTQVGTRRRQ